MALRRPARARTTPPTASLAPAAADPDAFERTRCGGEDVYCLLYTSGTTGQPKGVMIPHRQVAWNGYNTACCWQLQADDVSPIVTPLYHAGGLMAFLGPIFTAGGNIVLHRGFDPAEIFRTLAAERCTVMLGVPTIWKMLAEAPEFAGRRPFLPALPDVGRRAAADLAGRDLAAARRGLQARLRHDRGGGQLLHDDHPRFGRASWARSASR